MMRRTPVIAGFLLLLAVSIAGLVLIAKQERAVLFVHCGSSMRPAAEALAREVQRQLGIATVFNFGGSETLLPTITTSRRGDLFICHDPFPRDLKAVDLVADEAVVGRLVPVLVMTRARAGEFRSLSDLVKPGLRIGMLDARYATCGKMVEDALRQRGILDAVQANVKVVSRSHGDLAMAVELGSLDVATVWNFAAKLKEGTLAACAVSDPMPEVRVVFCRLSCAMAPEAAGRFLDVARSPTGLEIFRRFGYTADMGAGAAGLTP